VNRKWVNDGNNQKVLFITTEMGFDEVQTLIVSNLADVNENKILTAIYEGDEEERVAKAIQIVEYYKDNFRIEHLPDPSIVEIQTLVRFNYQEYGTDHVFYDYIFSSSGLLNEYRDLKIREDVILGMLSTMLKDIAVELNVFVKSGTQMNREWEQHKKGIRTQNMIRGSTAIADKIDVGAICLKVTDDDMIMLGPALQKLDMPNPTHVTDIYKARRSFYNNVRIWSRIDLGTCRVEDLFLTDANYNPIDITITEYITVNKLRKL
jgi:replicative DNA helicase